MDEINFNVNCKTPPRWKRPEDVMKLHKLKMRKRTMQPSSSVASTTNTDKEPKIKQKRNKNPFKLGNDEATEKKAKLNEIMNETSVDGTLFRLINFSQDSKNESQHDAQDISFSNILDKLATPPRISQKENKSKSKSTEELSADWTLRVKVRLISNTPFPWNQKLKTLEEATGITRFVRCIHETYPSSTGFNLEITPNSMFRQCCFVWQHPSIPWLDLFPRFGTKSSSNTLSLTLPKDVMYRDWIQSFSSLFQLLKSKHCPYFYLISNSFVCLFRCAGIAGYTDVNAMMTPTTRGFRQLLKDEHIQFTMPLSDTNEKNVTVNSVAANSSNKTIYSHNDDTGYDSLDIVNQLNNETEDELDVDNGILTDEEGETETWLKSMGVEESEIKKLNSSQLDLDITREKQIDKKPQSLIMVEGIETQSLFNFLMNCKSLIPTTGQFAGIPPTLLSPVAFVGSTLKPLTARESVIKLEDKRYHSIEIKGPILPHTIYSLCDLMKNSSVDKFTFTFGNLEASKSFSSVNGQQNRENSSPGKTPIIDTWLQQNLVHTGLPPCVMTNICSRDIKSFESIKYCDNHFTCL